MPLNRELLASVKLESVSDSDWVEEEHEKLNDGRSVTVDGLLHGPTVETNEDKDQNAATKNVIKCLKIALERGITSISLPEKQRPLIPEKDFFIESTMHYRTSRAPEIIACCGANATRIKQPRNATMRNARPSVTGSTYQQAPRLRNELAQISHTSEPFMYPDNGIDPDYASFVLPNASSDSGAARPCRRHLSSKTQTFGDFSTDDEEDDDEDEVPPVNFTFTDFSPMCYRHIREFFNVDPKAYGNVLHNSRWHSIPTPGKSAAQLFFCGRDWVIKTMTDQESDFLRKILHRYYYHVRDNPFTLLPHFVGHHRLRIGGQTHNFIIMQNVFATTNTIHEKFDLKGSTIGRFASDSEKRRATFTQKDLDINRPMHVGTERRLLLIEQIRKDCEFLKRSMIMDYSFLVGVHVLPTTGDPLASGNLGGSPGLLSRSIVDGASRFHTTLGSSTYGYTAGWDRSELFGNDSPDIINNGVKLDGRCFTADQGGMMSNKVPGLRQEIYYIGIIDILQEYNARKVVENAVFGAMHDRKRISCVNPNDYANRFIAFMSSIIV
ncbi:hypothetical protein JKF63_01874 [Porcisia hertigi]|uniref:PIPK domain-containing protein n=1 Tax=Porcisia hertigi TaxID=2761500 RepID=A0A836I073_9TRYP|nr:hypothetical protein JKF63_01874 [Porcisia hertigi]